MQDMVFDTSILILYLKKEDKYLYVKKLLTEAKRAKTSFYVSDITYMEVLYYLIRNAGEEKANKILANFTKLPLSFEPISRSILTQGAHFKAKGKISLADSIIAATAKEKNVPLLTKDPEFLLLKDEIRVEVL